MNSNLNLISIFRSLPNAAAILRGGSAYPGISGNVRFYRVGKEIMVAAQLTGLPISTDKCNSPVFGFHIHSGARCTGNVEDPFADALTHYNPNGCPHPYHAGDMPPLFGAGGNAFSAFLTDRFTLDEIIGKTVTIHSAPDDFTTQPGGNAGEKIACGEIISIKI